jgi:hypothetical protein
VIVAIFNPVTGERITDASVTASVTPPGFPPKPLEPMKIADTITYGNFFNFPREGVYHIHLSVKRQDRTKPTDIDLIYDHGHR